MRIDSATLSNLVTLAVLAALSTGCGGNSVGDADIAGDEDADAGDEDADAGDEDADAGDEDADVDSEDQVDSDVDGDADGDADRDGEVEADPCLEDEPCDDDRFCTVDDRCSAGECRGSARDCSDGVACNGVETCDDVSDSCLPGETTCDETEICDIGSGTCVTTCLGCLVSGFCYERGAVSPSTSCLVCNPDLTVDAWSTNDGARCDDDTFCNGADLCVDGECTEHEGDPCSDDGAFCNGDESCDEEGDECMHAGDPCGDDSEFCNGDESCDEEGDECVHAGDPCGDDGAFCNGDESCDEEGDECMHAGDPCTETSELCFEAETRCCTPDVRLGCSADNDVVWLDSCERPWDVVEDCPDENGRCEGGVCLCEPGWFDESCERWCVVHVDGSEGDDGNDGSSWGEAMATVTAALAAADPVGCEVWVSEGTYYPSDEEDRFATFALVSGVGLYGGFAGIELERDARDIETHRTVLSGDLDGDGLLDVGNVYHVVTGADGAVIDGFTIRNGYAFGDDSESHGAGMYNEHASPVVRNCLFTGNYARRRGGGMYNIDSSPTVTDCAFVNNDSGTSGGALANIDSSSPVVRNTEFRTNGHNGIGASMTRGGAIFNHNSSPTFVDCEIVNSRSNYGPMYNEESSSPLIINCVFSMNTGGIYNVDSSPMVLGCIFSDNASRVSGGAMSNFGSSPIIVDCVFGNNESHCTNSCYGGGISNREGSSPVIINSVFWGNSCDGSGGGVYNNSSSATILNSVFVGNRADDWHGGGMAGGLAPTIVNGCVFYDNYSRYEGGGIDASPELVLTNSIVYGNSTSSGNREIGSGDSLEATYSVVPRAFAGEGSFYADPQFVDAEGGDFRLRATSPCIDAGNTDSIHGDIADLDDDGDTREPCPFDIDGQDRVIDGDGDGSAVVDIGPHEYEP